MMDLNENQILFKKKTKEEIHKNKTSFCRKLWNNEISLDHFVKTIVFRFNAHIEYSTSIQSKNVIREVRDEFVSCVDKHKNISVMEKKKYFIVSYFNECLNKIIDEVSLN